ncbi:MAG TPA: Na/Pi cotransporter family protein [Alphaproteobacteria bacterium]
MNGTELLVDFLGSVALLLWGVRMVRTGMTRAFGPQLRRALSTFTRTRLSAFGTGLLVTGVLQSSTATALILASFAGRGLVTVGVALAVMLGADVGSTLVAQVFSFNIQAVAPLLIAAGVIAFMASKGDRPRNLGRITIGLGLMVLALKLLGEAAAPLRESAAFATLLGTMRGEPIIAMLVSALLTWLSHSSLSIVLLVMSLAGSGAIPMPLALAFVLGANVGGAIAPLAAQTGAAAPARRVPLGNLLMRSAGALAVLPFLPAALDFLATLEPASARVVINFHTAFNLAVAIVFLPLVEPVARLCALLLPEAPQTEIPGTPRYLDPDCLDSPSEALACATRETLNLGDHIAHMLKASMDVFERDDAKLMKQIEEADDAVDRLHEAIKLYLIKVSRAEMSIEESRRCVEILTFTTNLEHIGDIIDKNLMELAAKKIRNRYAFSPEGLAELKRFHARVSDNLQLAFNVFTARDKTLARRLLAEKSLVREQELAAAESHFARLRQGRPESIETSAIHLDVIRDLKRINGHLTSVAYPILEAAGELRQTRLLDEHAAAEAIRSDRHPQAT